jgi:hypothetical protein
MVEMTDKPGEGGDAAVERLVSTHLSAVLEGQRGRAAMAFRTALQNGQAGQVSPAIPLARGAADDAAHTRRTMWIWGGVPTALAACVAVAVGLQAFLGTPSGVKQSDRPFNVAPAAMEENFWTRDVDGGMIVGAQGPMRVRRQETVRQRRWVDPQDGAVYSFTEPGEKVGYEVVRPF